MLLDKEEISTSINSVTDALIRKEWSNKGVKIDIDLTKIPSYYYYSAGVAGEEITYDQRFNLPKKYIMRMTAVQYYQFLTEKVKYFSNTHTHYSNINLRKFTKLLSIFKAELICNYLNTDRELTIFHGKIGIFVSPNTRKHLSINFEYTPCYLRPIQADLFIEVEETASVKVMTLRLEVTEKTPLIRFNFAY